MLWTMTFLTLDGVMADPHLWHASYAGEDALELVAEQLGQADAMLLGRRTYDEFASWWPNQGDATPIARRTNAIPKLVVTSDPSGLTWGPAAALGSDPVAAARKATADGASVMVAGSGTLVRALLAAGVVDQLRMTIDPLVRGHGARLFADQGPTVPLALVEQRTLSNGVQYLSLRPLPEGQGA
jgi:dihydrofolate reductase